MNEILSSLLLDLTDLSDQEAEDLAFQEYVSHYLNHKTQKGMVGEILTHDGMSVVFAEWRFEHAFFTSAYKTTRQYNKGQFDRKRAERIRWIAPVIKGEIPDTEFCHIPNPRRRDKSGKIMMQRLYVLWEENYLVWLEPSETHGWWFSTAYIESKGRRHIRNIISGCVRKKISRD